MEEKKELEVINLRVIAKKIREQKKSFIKPLAIVFVISAVYIFSIPRYYSSDALFAPEIDNGMAGGTLSSIAASFGFDLNDMQTSDAITPLLYPDLMGLIGLHCLSNALGQFDSQRLRDIIQLFFAV